MLVRCHARLHDAIALRPRLWLLLAVLPALAATPLLLRTTLDVSFRPLFADDPELTQPTREFAARFGQPGGAWIGAVVAPAGGGSAADAAVAARIDSAAVRLAGLPHVAAVLAPPAAGTISADSRFALLMVALDLPLEDLPARTAAVRSLEGVLGEALGDVADAHYVGVSVVEAAYATLVLRSMGLAFVLNTAGVIAVLWLLFGSWGGVIVPLSGVLVGGPIALAALVAAGQQLTIVNSMVPTVMLIIGVADGLHMVRSFDELRSRGAGRRAAVRAMYERMALPCLLTTLTTVCGFAALRVADVSAVRDFGGSVALCIGVVYLASLVTVPALLHVLPAALLPSGRGRGAGPARRWALWSRRLVAARPGSIVVAAAVVIAVMTVSLPWLKVDQRFNEEVAATQPVRAAQALLEREFGGFLGPELFVTRTDGQPPAARDLPLLERAAAAVAAVPLVDRVEGPVTGDGAALLVRTGDIGTRQALLLARDAEARAAVALGDDWRVQVVGEWWLAQLGMAGMLRDMLAGFAASALLVVPLIALGLRSVRLTLIAILPNLIPLLFALAFMAWTGIAVRIGTSMILAIALAIGVDDTIHVLARLRAESARRCPAAAVRVTLRGAGVGMLYTTAVLVLGFAAMSVSPLLAIRDMGLVAAATLLAALLADAYLAPALYLLTAGRAGRVRHPIAVPTSCDGSVPHATAATL